MFDINSLATPKVLNELSYEDILNQNIANIISNGDLRVD